MTLLDTLDWIYARALKSAFEEAHHVLESCTKDDALAIFRDLARQAAKDADTLQSCAQSPESGARVLEAIFGETRH